MKLLSLIMIVRNEAPLLPHFLEHHKDLFDEMIIVDTGSEDTTPQLVENSGATLIRHVWRDDFSKARNLGLNQARGRWLLLLDADERISAGDFSKLRSFLAKAPEAVYLQKTINYSKNSHLEWQPVRGTYPQEEKGHLGFFVAQRAGLFPNGHGLAFSGRVHESILPAAKNVGIDTFSLDIPVHHYGYVQSPLVNRRRQVRYRKLVNLKLTENPEDWSAMLEMASIQLEDSQILAAEELLEQICKGPKDHPVVMRGFFILGKIKGEAGNIEAARQLLELAINAEPTFIFAWLEAIRLEANQGSWSAVSQLLERAKDHFPEKEPLLERQKLVFLVKTGQLNEATTVARQLAEFCPQWKDISLLATKLAQKQNPPGPRHGEDSQ